MNIKILGGIILIGILFITGCIKVGEELSTKPTEALEENVEETKKIEEKIVVEEVKKTEPAKPKIESKPKLEIISYNDKISEFGEMGSYLHIVGEVKNSGNAEAHSVKVTAKFYKDDKFIDRAYTYVDNSDIPAGEIDTFEIIWEKQDYDKYELSVSSSSW